MNAPTSDLNSLATHLRRRLRGIGEGARKLEDLVERQLEELAGRGARSEPGEAIALPSVSNLEALWYRYPEERSI
jgi:hypothetical protein